MSKIRKALDKAKKSRGLTDDVVLDWEEAAPRETSPQKKQGQEDSREETRRDINPAYSCTRVLNTDPSALRKNKIVSICHENDVADQIKILRTEVLKGMEQGGGSTLLVTSAKRGEGKSITAINLALSIAQELDRTVLLVDANLRNPSIHRYLGFDNLPGLADYLKNGTKIPDLLINPGIRKLTVLPSGKPPRNPSELLGAPRMDALVREMKGRYPDRVIIFDSPSLLASADPLALARFVDGVLLVVEAEHTSKEDVRRSVELLKGSKIVGTVLNKARE